MADHQNLDVYSAIGIYVECLPDFNAPIPKPDELPSSFDAVEGVSDSDWSWLRSTVSNFSRSADHRDRQFIDALRTLVRNGLGRLNWTLLSTDYGSQNAVRMRWIRWSEAGLFSALHERALEGSVAAVLLEDLRQLALQERAYAERIENHRRRRVQTKTGKSP